jgi:toxin ParE1/3/4
LNLRWLPEAERNFTSQIDYVADRNVSAAIRMGDLIEAAVSRLSDFPESGRIGRVADTRELVVTGTPYVVVYSVSQDAILIFAYFTGGRCGRRTLRSNAARGAC